MGQVFMYFTKNYSRINLKLSIVAQEFFCNPRSSKPSCTIACARVDATREYWKIASHGGQFWVYSTIVSTTKKPPLGSYFRTIKGWQYIHSYTITDDSIWLLQAFSLLVFAKRIILKASVKPTMVCFLFGLLSFIIHIYAVQFGKSHMCECCMQVTPHCG